MGLIVSATAVTNMNDTDAHKLAEMLDVKLWSIDLHFRPHAYCLPEIVIRPPNPQTAAYIAEKYCGVNYDEKKHARTITVRRRVLMRAFLKRMMPCLEPLKQKKADIALRMLNVADAKLDGRIDELNDLAERFKEVDQLSR